MAGAFISLMAVEKWRSKELNPARHNMCKAYNVVLRVPGVIDHVEDLLIKLALLFGMFGFALDIL